ncbi:protocadherin [Rosistilla oblonga]|uniref:protocadherin n=1 Tax=Rosistilla oblonga TaxID=2527990 RepID=UPI003A97A1E5
MFSLPLADCLGRGRGGGGFGGGHGGGFGGGGGGFGGGGHGGAGFGGGGFGGGAGFGGGHAGGGLGGSGLGGSGLGGSGLGGSGLGGSGLGGSGLGGSGLGRGGLGSDGLGGSGLGGSGLGRGGLGGSGLGGGGLGADGLGGSGLGRGASGLGGRGAGGQDAGSNRFSAPTRNQLSGFLGLPSDDGLHSLSGNRGDNFDVNHGTAEGPRGGNAAGVAVTGPQGNTAGRAVGVGPDGGVATAGGVRGTDGGAAARGAAVGPNGGVAAGSAARGPDGGAAARGAAVGPNGGVAAGSAARGPDGGAAARGAAVGPNGRVAAGSAVRGPDGGAAARGVVAGPAGAAAGFARVTPSNRYTTAVGVRTNYNHWDIYGGRWYTDHPGAWFAAGWATGAAWRAASWASVGAWMDYYPTTPVYYDYGNNITYENNNVYVDGQDAGTTEQYYAQATELAKSGATAKAPSDGDWLPLGVFALTKNRQTNAIVTIQLAVNKQGVIRGNYTDTKTGKTMVIQGAVDKKTQQVAFTVGDNQSNLIETGLYNLTKDEAPALVHIGDGKTEQYLLVRLKNKDQDSADADSSPTS